MLYTWLYSPVITSKRRVTQLLVLFKSRCSSIYRQFLEFEFEFEFTMTMTMTMTMTIRGYVLGSNIYMGEFDNETPYYRKHAF